VGQNTAFGPNFGTSPGALQQPKQPPSSPTPPPSNPTNPGVSIDLSIPVGGFPSTYVVGGNDLTPRTNASQMMTAALGFMFMFMFMYLVIVYYVLVL